ncbi:DnaJ domain-containing protein [Rickettsiella endosymbiont of Dermanyssus gallinae]|uniref:DnaJ domain-containing protein n=1 Tax=Rickettsiella endosymbiont of Dermanyssus gallinae TaxID=2856608 RepID=UPI001C52998A|nr:DnaJ domain-containing protein [Rickettsiella endosymbiont of Dermanyssus gallinae]
MHNFYHVLGVSSNTSSQAIKRAYREKALLEHPDKGGDAQKMSLLTTAYQTLSDPLKRQQFDKDWYVFNASNESEMVVTPEGYLPTAGTSFSQKFRKQHSEFIKQCYAKPLHKSSVAQYLKPFHSDLYLSKEDKKESHIFALMQQRKTTDAELNISFQALTPEKSVNYFLEFLQGHYSWQALQDLTQEFSGKLKQLETLGQQAGYESQLYQGIYEILLIAARETTPTEKILYSLKKITDYAKVTADQSMTFMAPLLQSKYFRHLHAQALHWYWLSDEQVLEESFLRVFNGQKAIEKLIEKLKSQVSEKQSADQSSGQLTQLLRYARLLFKLEQDIQKRSFTTHENRAAFYREKAFHLLDWLPAIMGFAEYAVLVNTLLQIGLTLQKASAQESNPILRMADERLVAQIYLEAIGVARHATPEVELYACLHSIKCLMSCHYLHSESEQIIEALQHRALWLADLFPFFQATQSNANLLAEEDKNLLLMRQLLHALIDKIDNKKEDVEKAEIDHSYVRVFYQAYEACLKNWYQKNHDPELEKKFRQRLMQELLVSKEWTSDDLDYNLNAPWPLDNLSEEGWTQPEPALPLAQKENVPTYKTIHGVEISYKSGNMAFILDYCEDNESDYNRLLTLFDLNEMFQRRLGSALFSLDAADPDMPYHPFNQMRFAPTTLHHSPLLHTMFLTDYLLKFLTVDQEVQRRDPYQLRSLDEITQHLPDYLKKVITDFHASHHEASLNRFWIESEEVDLAIDDENANKDGHVLFALGDLKMVVKHHKLTRDAEGNLVDKADEEEGWDCYVLTPEQKQALEEGKRVIPDSALIIVKESWELIFWENHKATTRCSLEGDKHLLIRLNGRPRDENEKVKIDDSESLRQIYRIVLKAATKADMPHRYSPEFIFAQEFTKYYNEFAIYFPEFGRLRELSKVATLVNIMAAQRAANKEEIQLSENRLQDKKYWTAAEHDYWKETEEEIKKLVRENTREQFQEWRRQLSKEKLTQSRQTSLNDIRRQIGSLSFTKNSPEIVELCDKFYEETKAKIIAEHGRSGWNSVSHKIRSEAIDPKVPQLILDLQSQKKTACRKQLLELFKNELAGLFFSNPSQLIDKFLEANDKPLLDQLVAYDKKQVAKKIKEVYPEHTEESLDRAMNHSLLVIDDIVEKETPAALEQHKQQLKKRLDERKVLEKSFVDLGFACDADEIDIKGTCLWVPASFRHDVDKGHTRTVYGGVHILGGARQIGAAQTQVLARQTNQVGQRSAQNRINYQAQSNHAREILHKKLSILQGGQQDAVRTQQLPDGRIRYYENERPSSTPGPTRGAAYVTEYNPKTGQVRTWNECYDQKGNVNRVHPKTLDGQKLRGQHYPPTKSELRAWSTLSTN